MSKLVKDGGCKTNENNWPEDRIEKNTLVDDQGNIIPEAKSWWHSDYKDLPYQFTYPFYNKLVDQMK